MGIAVNLTLVNQAFLAFVHELNRVFYRQYMLITVVVDKIEHRRHRGTFAGTGRPGHQNNSTWRFRDLLEHRPHTQIIHAQYFGGNGTEYRTGTAVLVEGVNAETRHTGNFKREVSFQEFFIILALFIVHDVIHQAVYLFMVHRWQIDTAHIAIHPNHRWQPSGQV